MSPLIALTLGITLIVGLFCASVFFPVLAPIFNQTGMR